MAGYSGTPLAKKLGIKPSAILLLIHAPDGLEELYDTLPEDVRIIQDQAEAADVAAVFVTQHADLQKWMAALHPLLAKGGRLWIGWPKKASKMPTDLDFDTVQHEGLDVGLVDTKICAINAVWTGLCFMRRTKTAERVN